jgi:hypothetical protein
LEIIKYRMNYDLKKTLNENISTIKEQQNDCPNQIDLSELERLAEKTGETVKKMQTWFVRMGYGEERAKEIYNTVKSLLNKNVVDDLTGECTNALYYFLERFRISGSRGWFVSGFDFKERIEEFIDGFYDDDPRVTRYLQATLELLTKGESMKKEKRTTPTTTPAPTATTTTPSPTPTATTPTTTPAPTTKKVINWKRS